MQTLHHRYVQHGTVQIHVELIKSCIAPNTSSNKTFNSGAFICKKYSVHTAIYSVLYCRYSIVNHHKGEAKGDIVYKEVLLPKEI